MAEKVLFVDDDPNILDAFKRHFRKELPVEVAAGPEEGLKSVSERGPYAVIVSDYRMPGMNGVQFLAAVKSMAPDSVRIILTGYADLQTAIAAVNEGNIFRLMTKPCPPETILTALGAGLRQYRLITAERELLQKTLRGSIEILTELLSLTKPEAFGRSSRIKRQAAEVAQYMGIFDDWKIETAAMVSQIGIVTVPDEVLGKAYRGEELNPEEKRLFENHPRVASDLLSRIPRLEEISEIVGYQEKNYDGSGPPEDGKQGADIPLGARLLKALLDFDILITAGIPKADALSRMKERVGFYDPAILDALDKVFGMKGRFVAKAVSIQELQPRMILAEDLSSVRGQLLITRGQEISPLMLKRLKSFSVTLKVKEPVRVFVRQQG